MSTDPETGPPPDRAPDPDAPIDLDAELATIDDDAVERAGAQSFYDRLKNNFSRGPLGPYWARIRLLWELLHDYAAGRYREVPWPTVAAATVALLYLANPLDVIPDFIPILGQLDDIAVLLLVWRAVEVDLRRYADHRGLDPAEFGWS